MASDNVGARPDRRTGLHFAGTCASVRRARPLLGTFVEIAASGDAHGLDAAVDAAFAAVARVHDLMSFHDPHSDVSRINRDAAVEEVAVDAWTYEVIAAAVDLTRRSNGAFDITVAPALQRLGLLPRLDGRPAAEGRVGPDAIALSPGRRLRFRDPATRIDLGGIAKGFAVDRALETLRARGMTRGFVNAGGDLAAFGTDAETIHIRDPRDPRRAIACIDVANEAVASSGMRFDPFGSADATACAVIDARTGAPVRAIAGATIRAPDCVVADALTKVAMVAGEAAAPLLENFDASAMLVLHDGDIRTSPTWKPSHAA
jgi:thiamine biosynthesis lipoprotein